MIETQSYQSCNAPVVVASELAEHPDTDVQPTRHEESGDTDEGPAKDHNSRTFVLRCPGIVCRCAILWWWTHGEVCCLKLFLCLDQYKGCEVTGRWMEGVKLDQKRSRIRRAKAGDRAAWVVVGLKRRTRRKPGTTRTCQVGSRCHWAG